MLNKTIPRKFTVYIFPYLE